MVLLGLPAQSQLSQPHFGTKFGQQRRLPPLLLYFWCPPLCCCPLLCQSAASHPTAARHLRPLPHRGSCCPLLHASRWLLSSKRLSWLSPQCCCCGAILLLHGWHQWPLSLGMSPLTSVMLLCSSPAFLDKMSIHVAKNFLDLPKIKIPLILGIWGKRFMCEALCWSCTSLA